MSARIERALAPQWIAVALFVGLTFMAVAIAVTLSGSPVVVLHANSTLAAGSIAETTSGARACQSGEFIPAGTSAIRLTLAAEVGPGVDVTALSGSHVLTSGGVGDGWTGGSVTVPVRPIRHASSDTRICFGLDPSKESVEIVGSPTSSVVAAKGGNGEPLPGRLKVEYLTRTGHSWWSVAPEVARRIGLDHAPSGTWVVLTLIALMGTVIAISSWLVLRELR